MPFRGVGVLSAGGEDFVAEVVVARRAERRFGRRRALGPVDLTVEEGSFAVVTGPNGSGKTTLLRLVAGLLAPTRGTLDVRVDRARIGFVGHDPLLYRDLTGAENLDLYGRLYRVPERRERIGMLLERFDLWSARNDRAGRYSRGMLQRLALCRALLHEPALLVLDEPFNALDADGSALLDRQLAELAGRATLILATHDPDRVAPLATTRLALG